MKLRCTARLVCFKVSIEFRELFLPGHQMGKKMIRKEKRIARLPQGTIKLLYLGSCNKSGPQFGQSARLYRFKTANPKMGLQGNGGFT